MLALPGDEVDMFKLYLSSSPSRNSNEQVHRLHEAIKGFVFLGTRHHGQHRTDLTKLSYMLHYLFMKSNSVANAIEQTPRINRDFRMLGGEKLPLTCFYETEPVKPLVRVLFLIVGRLT
jgi:hypothetical protein